MDDAQLRPLLHQVANLLAVIQVQVETARALGTAEAAQQAMALIQRSADETAALLRSARHAGREQGQPARRADACLEPQEAPPPASKHPSRSSARRRE